MKIRLLGTLEVERDGNGVALPRSRKTRALLGYLAATGRRHRRAWLCDLLWDGPADPRAALRWSLAKLRPILDTAGGGHLVADADSVELDREGLGIDVEELQILVGDGLDHTPTQRLQEASRLFGGEFLEGLELSGCYRFDAWCSGRRQIFRQLRRQTFAELVGRFENEPSAGLTYALERLGFDPFSEAAYVDVIRMSAALGQLREALDYCERCALMLEREFDVGPSEALLTLQRSLESVPTAEPSTEPPPAPGAHEAAAARRALRRGRLGETVRLITSCLLGIGEAGSERRPSLRMELLELLVHPAMEHHRPPQLARWLREAIDEARETGMTELARFGFYLIANLHYQRGDFEGAFESTGRAEGAGRAADPHTMVGAIADTARCLGMLERDLDRAERLAHEAAELAAALDEELLEIPMAFGLIHRHRGRYGEALEAFTRALAIARDTEDEWWESTCMLWLPMLHLERGQPVDALVACGELRPVLRRLGTPAEAAFTSALELLARARVEDDAPPSVSLGAELDALREQDSRWMLAYVQVEAALHDLHATQNDSAGRRALEALAAAEAVGRRSEVAMAHALLGRIALRRGDPGEAEAHMPAARRHLSEPGVLSARAVEVVGALTDPASAEPEGERDRDGSNAPSNGFL